MVDFAQALFDETDDSLPTGPAHFPALWAEALRITERMHRHAPAQAP